MQLNNNIIIILLAAILAPIQLWLWQKRKNYFLIPLIALVCCSIYFQARSGVIYAAGIAFYCYIKRYKINNAYTFAIIVLIPIILLSVKTDSSLGRFYIIKNTVQIIKNNFPNEITDFNLAYHHYIIDKFSGTYLLNTKENYLADNTFYANNDYLQFVAEFGIFGLIGVTIFFLIAIPYILKNIRHHLVSNEDYFITTFIPFLIGGFISYPFHNYYTIYLFSSLAVLRLLMLICNKSQRKSHQRVMIGYIILSLLLLSVNEYSFYQSNKRMKEVSALEKIGQNNDALKLLDLEIKSNGFQKANTLKFASLLAGFRLYDSSIKILLQNHNKCCSREFHLLLGDMYNFNDDSANAKVQYLNALYITPHKLVARNKLMLLYQKYQDTVKLKFWANEIIHTPLKIKSDEAETIQNEAKRLLESLQ